MHRNLKEIVCSWIQLLYKSISIVTLKGWKEIHRAWDRVKRILLDLARLEAEYYFYIYFFKLMQPLTVSQCVTVHCKTTPCLRNPYRKLKSEISQDYANGNLKEIVRSWIWLLYKSHTSIVPLKGWKEIHMTRILLDLAQDRKVPIRPGEGRMDPTGPSTG